MCQYIDLSCDCYAPLLEVLEKLGEEMKSLAPSEIFAVVHVGEFALHVLICTFNTDHCVCRHSVCIVARLGRPNYLVSGDRSTHIVEILDGHHTDILTLYVSSR